MVARVVLFLRAALAFGSAAAVQASNGTFTVVSYNIAALPGFLSGSNPRVNVPIIAPRLAPYGIVNVQEDFNYHKPLYAGDNHPHRTVTSGGVPFGSGLNTMSKYPIIDVQRVKWSKCSSIWYADCLTPKGFTLLRARLDEGVYIDVYNLHTDAGDTSFDVAARKSNIAQVVSYINLNSIGNPVLIYGDTNALYTNSTDGLRQFTSAGFTDAWVQMIRGERGEPAVGSPSLYCPEDGKGVSNECETLDKIFYRSGPAVTLSATRYNNENLAFQDSAGRPLSDHYPITADFTYTLSQTHRLTDLAGGTGGAWFSNLPLIPSPAPPLMSITLSGADRFDYISLTLFSGVAFRHGGSGGTPSTLTLSSGERVTKLRVDTGGYKGAARVFYVSVETSSGRSLSAGKQTGTSVTWTAPNGMGLKGVYGRAGDGVNMLGGIWG